MPTIRHQPDRAMPTTRHRPDRGGTTRGNDEIVLLIRCGADRHALSARQVIDIIASYLATGGHLEDPGAPTDPYTPLHKIGEQYRYGNVTGWLLAERPDVIDHYRLTAHAWARSFFGVTFPDVTW